MSYSETNSVWVCGHKNPDTDSVASAASYAYLKSQINKDYEFAEGYRERGRSAYIGVNISL